LDSLIDAETLVPSNFSSGSKLARTPPSREMTRKVIGVAETDTNGLNGSTSRGGSCTNIATGKNAELF